MLFGAGSIWCAWSGAADMLIVARVLLGLGAAILTPLSMSMLPVLFEPREQQRAIALMSLFTMVGIPLGPIVGGALLQHFWWGSVFVINIPTALIAVAAVIALMPETRGDRAAGIDYAGILASSLGLISLTYGLIQGPESGWASPRVLGTLIAGIGLLAAFVWWERHSPAPLLDVSLFSSRAYTTGAAFATVISLVLFGVLFVLPQLLQAVLGADALGTGLRMLPMLGGLIVGFQVSNRLVPRLGARPALLAGFVLLAAGAVIGTMTGADTGYGFVAMWTAVFGLGLGFGLPTAMVIALGAVSRERAGAGSAMLMAFGQVGSVLGIAVLGTIQSVGYRARLVTTGLPDAAAHAARQSATAGVAVAGELRSRLLASVRDAFTHGMSLTLWATGGVAVAGILLTLLVLAPAKSPRRNPTPGRIGG